MLDVAQIVALHEAGLPHPFIAEKLGVSKERIARRLKRAGKMRARPSQFTAQLLLFYGRETSMRGLDDIGNQPDAWRIPASYKIRPAS